MRKTVFYFVVILALVAISWFFRERKIEKKDILGTVSQSSSTPQAVDVKVLEIPFNGKNLGVYWFEVLDSANIELISNFEDQTRSDEVFEKHKCKYLVSGGFYTKDGQPIGLFVSEGEKVQDWVKNSLFNGVYSVNQMEVPRITQEPTRDPARIALQSGPMLKENAEFKKLSIKNDQPERRSVVATTGENKSIFMIIHDKNSVFLGPLLADLPEVIGLFEEKTGVILADVLNLDGGTASTLYTGEINLPELSPAGSFFCIKN